MGGGQSKARAQSLEQEVARLKQELSDAKHASPRPTDRDRVPEAEAARLASQDGEKRDTPKRMESAGDMILKLAEDSTGQNLREKINQRGGYVTIEDMKQLLPDQEESFIEEVFAACDFNRDGNVDLGEFERAVKLQTPAVDPLEHVSKLLEDAGAVKAIAHEVMGLIGNCRSDPADALSNLEESEIARIIREAATPVASALSKHFKDVKSKRRMSEISIETYANNAKYATMPGVYEGAFGTIDEFLQGLDAIGLPQPRVFEGMQDDFMDGEDSTDIFTTSNYGGIKTTPQTEWEFIVCPDMTKTYPGGRHPFKIETFMAAARVGEFDLPLSELGLSAGERAAVEVSLLRRVKTQLDLGRLKAAIGRRKHCRPSDVEDIKSALESTLFSESSMNRAKRAGDESGVLPGEAMSMALLADTIEAIKKYVTPEEILALIEAERDRLGQAKLTREELIGLRLYTGPPFIKFNGVLRESSGKMPASLTAHLKGNKYVTSIHCAVSGMVKLSKVTRIPDERKVYRGMSSMRLPKAFWVDDEHGARGGVEYGFLSTTTKREVAMQYIGDGKLATIFEISVGMIDRGSSIAFLSQFPGEEEVLMPPRSNIEVVGSPTIQETEKGPVIVIPARINANLKAKTMEEVIAQRKDLHMSLVKNVTREIARDIKVIEESDEFIERAKKDFSSKNAAGRLVRSVTEECEHIVDMHASKDVVWYNNDRNYARILGEAIRLKRDALGKIEFWIDNRDEWATDHAKRSFIEVSRMHYGQMMEIFYNARESGDQEQTRHTALQICKKWGFVSESLDEIDDNGETPLHSCAAQADVRAVKLLLEAGAVVDIQDDEGTTALGEAALGGINDTLAMLLQAGADPNSANFVDGRTPLIGAASGGHSQCCGALIDAKADVNLADKNGFSPVMWAAQTNKTGTVQYLISRKADVHAHARGWNALFDAANSGHVGPARCLIEAGINVNSHRESSGMCPLSFACMHGHLEFVEFMLDEGKANIEERNDREETPLHYAAKKGHANVVKALLDRGANPLAENDACDTADDVSSDSECIRLISQASHKVGREYTDVLSLQVGMKISGLYKSNGKWYGGVIAGKEEDGRFIVDWDDGDKKDKIKPLSELAVRLSSVRPALWCTGVQVGDTVRASNRTSVGEYTVSLVTADVGEDCADFVCKLYSKSLESSLSDVTPKHLWVSLDKFAREERVALEFTVDLNRRFVDPICPPIGLGVKALYRSNGEWYDAIIDSTEEAGEAGNLTVIWMDGDEDDRTKTRSEIAMPLAATPPTLWAASVRVGSQVRGYHDEDWTACKVMSVTQGSEDGPSAGWAFDLQVTESSTILSGLEPRAIMVTLDNFEGIGAS